MPIYALGDVEPTIDPSAYIHPDAVIIGDVHIGAESSVWPGAVIRGDDGAIYVGARTSIQDGAVLHTTPMTPTRVGDDCVIGHIVHLEGCTIEDRSLVGSGSVVLHNAVIGPDALVGAGAVVSNNTVVPPMAQALGIPARIKENAVSVAMITTAKQSYVDRAKRFEKELRRLD